MENAAWRSHNWGDLRGRKVAFIKPDRAFLQYHCSRCMRDFVEVSTTGERYAVYVGAFDFRRLADFINKRWLEESCPGGPSPQDTEVRRQLSENPL